MDASRATTILHHHIQWLQDNRRKGVAQALEMILTEYSEKQDEGSQEPAQEEIEWKIGEDYRCRYGFRRRLLAITCHGTLVVVSVNERGQITDHVYTVNQQGMQHGNGRECDHDIVGPWEQPKKPERRLVKLYRHRANCNYYADLDENGVRTGNWEYVGNAWVTEGEFAEEETESWEDL